MRTTDASARVRSWVATLGGRQFLTSNAAKCYPYPTTGVYSPCYRWVIVRTVCTVGLPLPLVAYRYRNLKYVLLAGTNENTFKPLRMCDVRLLYQSTHEIPIKIHLELMSGLFDPFSFLPFIEKAKQNKQITMTTVSSPLKLAISLLVIAALVATHMHFKKVRRVS
jgi:hypothetical protein